MKGKSYSKVINVYDASNKRIDFIFKNFKRIYLSFSGGKDSGVMLNLVLDYMKKKIKANAKANKIIKIYEERYNELYKNMGTKMLF